MALNLDQPLRFWPLASLDQGDSVTVGRSDIDVYISLPQDGAALLRRLQVGDSPAQAAHWYAEEFSNAVDIHGFIQALTEVEFVDTTPSDLSRAVPTAEGSQTAVPGQRVGTMLFSRWAWLVYGALAVAGGWVLFSEPQLRPGPRQLHFGTSITVTYLLITVGLVPFLLAHEGFHSLAGRRLGLRSATHVSHRFLFLVIETRLDGLVAVPRRQRILPILAGPLFDVLAFFALTIFAYLLGPVRSTESVARDIALALAYAMLIRVIWQFYFCMQTDIYALVSVLLGTNDLHGASRWQLGLWVNRLARTGRTSRIAATAWSPQDRRHARWYAPVMVIGYALLLITAVMTVVPAFGYLWSRAVTSIGAGATIARPTSVVDAVAFMSLNLIQVGVAGALFISARRNRLAPDSKELS